MKIDLVIFDLDGTLVRSHENIYQSMIYAFNQLNIEHNISLEEFNKYIGWHFEDIFSAFGIEVADFEEFLTIYKNSYFDFIYKSTLYNNVIEVLQWLKKENIQVALLTTKGQDQAEKNISHFELDDYFNFIMGRRSGIAHKPDPEPLLFIANNLNISIDNVLMVGDSEMDIQCAHNAKTYSCGVTYGYRTKDLIENEKPDIIVDDLIELKNYLLETE